MQIELFQISYSHYLSGESEPLLVKWKEISALATIIESDVYEFAMHAALAEKITYYFHSRLVLWLVLGAAEHFYGATCVRLSAVETLAVQYAPKAPPDLNIGCVVRVMVAAQDKRNWPEHAVALLKSWDGAYWDFKLRQCDLGNRLSFREADRERESEDARRSSIFSVVPHLQYLI